MSICGNSELQDGPRGLYDAHKCWRSTCLGQRRMPPTGKRGMICDDGEGIVMFSCIDHFILRVHFIGIRPSGGGFGADNK